MTSAPPLLDGENVVFDHIPTLAKYKRAALMLLGISLLPTLVFSIVFPDTYWVILPMFLTCILLVQERFKLGRHRAWITNQRIIFQDGGSVPLDAVTGVTAGTIAVNVRHSGGKRALPLYYPADPAALAQAIQTNTGAKDAD